MSICSAPMVNNLMGIRSIRSTPRQSRLWQQLCLVFGIEETVCLRLTFRLRIRTKTHQKALFVTNAWVDDKNGRQHAMKNKTDWEWEAWFWELIIGTPFFNFCKNINYTALKIASANVTIKLFAQRYNMTEKTRKKRKKQPQKGIKEASCGWVWFCSQQIVEFPSLTQTFACHHQFEDRKLDIA